MANDKWAELLLEAINKIAYSPANTWNQAVNYAGLPAPATVGGATWLVLVGTGIWPINKPSGWYYSDGTSWLYLGSYNPVASGGNVTVTNFPVPGSTGEVSTVVVQPDGTRLLATDNSRKGFVLTVTTGVVYVGIGFLPSSTQHTYRMTNHCVVEKDGYVGEVYATAQDTSKIICITEIK